MSSQHRTLFETPGWNLGEVVAEKGKSKKSRKRERRMLETVEKIKNNIEKLKTGKERIDIGSGDGNEAEQRTNKKLRKTNEKGVVEKQSKGSIKDNGKSETSESKKPHDSERQLSEEVEKIVNSFKELKNRKKRMGIGGESEIGAGQRENKKSRKRNKKGVVEKHSVVSAESEDKSELVKDADSVYGHLQIKEQITDNDASSSNSKVATSESKKRKKIQKGKPPNQELFNGSDANIQKHHHISTTQQASSIPSAVSASTSNIQSKSYAANSKKSLTTSRFRWINEKLYTSTSTTAYELFASTPSLFAEYHEGFRSAVEAWPVNPVDVMIEYLQSKPKDTVVADLGCGEGKIAENVQCKVVSFDLSGGDRIVKCDIGKLPMPGELFDVAILCLSLMGTNYIDFIREAYRILKKDGELKIAEVISRFTDIDAFVALLSEVGFRLVRKDDKNKMFIQFDFVKSKPIGAKKSKLSDASKLLKPCVYKKR
ncbi:11073_t:CDS:2 [Paraglomus brasilianum]|uniref:Ribosomal RNA-processing protein 8 n=1 Tax=Paraglomus brasilianum TaxID=144538 RepID=A0A9N8ZV70_9GLOM|nr:11073_t:CDS:2 [Paraglomus brasilianum]